MLYTFEGDIVHIIMTNAKEFDKCLIREIQTTHNVCMTVNHKYLKTVYLGKHATIIISSWHLLWVGTLNSWYVLHNIITSDYEMVAFALFYN